MVARVLIILAVAAAAGAVAVFLTSQGGSHQLHCSTFHSSARANSSLADRRRSPGLPDGQVLVTGGWDVNHAVAAAELYDPGTRSWSATGSMATPRAFHTATLLPDGSVLVAGGDGPLASAELYDPSGRTWTATARMGTPRAYHTATLLPDGEVLVAGGMGAASTERYDPGSP